MKYDVLIYVEDPGAANYVMGLSNFLKTKGMSVIFLANGHAIDYLAKKDFPFTKLDEINPDQMITIYQPKVILVGTSENVDSIGLELISVAKEKTIPTIGFVDACSNAAYRFRGRTESPLYYAPNMLIVPDRWTKQAYLDLGYEMKNVFVCGHPYYDDLLEIKKILSGIKRADMRKKTFPDCDAENRLIITFIAEVSTGLNPEQYRYSPEYTLNGWGREKERTKIVLEEFLDGLSALNQKPFLVLRLHPKNTKDEFENYLQYFDFVSQNEPPLEVIFSSDLIVGMGSSLVFESYMLGKKTLSILPRECEKDWLPAIKLNLIPCATTQPEIRSLLLTLLQANTFDCEIDNELMTYNSLNYMLKVVEQCIA